MRWKGRSVVLPDKDAVDPRYLPDYMEFTQAQICRLLRKSLKRKDGKVPVWLYFDGSKMLVKFETPFGEPDDRAT